MVHANLRLPDEAATARLAQDVAAVLKAGDLVALSGGLGAGKTTFARALIRALAGDPALEVQSPTFPLRLDHALPRLRIAHADLYRLGDARELDEIGLDEAIAEGALLVEWPERLPPDLERRPARSFLRDRRRRPTRRDRRARKLAGAARAHRAHPRLSRRERPARRDARAAGRRRIDARLRAHRLRGKTAILMNAPARERGPPIYDGRSYDAVAHRALDVRSFVAIDLALRRAGIRAPEIRAADMEAGLLLVEDLGDEGVVDAAGAPIMERYEAAIDLLVYMHGRPWPEEAALPGGGRYALPHYDRDALLVEVSLFPDWFGGKGGEAAFPPERRDDFLADWSRLLETVDAGGRPGSCAISIRPTSFGRRASPASPGSASSTSRTR